MRKRLSEWMSKWQTDGLADQQPGWLHNWLTHWLITDWPTGHPTGLAEPWHPATMDPRNLGNWRNRESWNLSLSLAILASVEPCNLGKLELELWNPATGKNKPRSLNAPNLHLLASHGLRDMQIISHPEKAMLRHVRGIFRPCCFRVERCEPPGGRRWGYFRMWLLTLF